MLMLEVYLKSACKYRLTTLLFTVILIQARGYCQKLEYVKCEQFFLVAFLLWRVGTCH